MPDTTIHTIALRVAELVASGLTRADIEALLEIREANRRAVRITHLLRNGKTIHSDRRIRLWAMGKDAVARNEWTARRHGWELSTLLFSEAWRIMRNGENIALPL